MLSTNGEAASTSIEGASAGAALFVLSAALLTLEVLQTRLFAYCLDPLLFYGAVGITLLGLGASGTTLALWDGWRSFSLGTLGAASCAAFAASLVAVHALFARVSPSLSLDLSLGALAVFTILAVPYFFAGLGVTASLVAAGRRAHRAYFANLIGSAAGCLVVFFALKPLGAPLLLGVTAALGILAGILFLRCGAGHRARLALGLSAAVVAVALTFGDRLFAFQPDPLGQLAGLQGQLGKTNQIERVYGAWDPTGRVEIHRLGDLKGTLTAPVDVYFFSQDGSAGSVLLGVGNDLARAAGFFERTLYGAGHVLLGRAGANVLVIGLGGGPDVQAAHFFRARSVTGVDINASAIEAVAGPLAAFTGDPYGRPNTRTLNLDGRTFVRSTTETYDVIVMSGVDTKSVWAAGSLAMSENHLYTVEAFEEYLDRLSPGGVLAMLRFHDRLRLASLAVAALRARGVAHPEHHIALLEQQAWSSVLVARDPLTQEGIARLTAWVASIPRDGTGIRLPPYEPLFTLARPPRLLYPGSEGGGDLAASFLEAVAHGREEAFLEELPFDASPTTDDWPFFFETQRRDRLFTEPSWIYQRLARLLAIMSLLALVAVAAPVPILRRRTASAGFVRTLVYFGSLGAGFMLLEIGLVQKLVLFLGHPAYSVTVVLAALLVWAGLGSAVAGRWQGPGSRIVRRLAVPVILGWGLALTLWLDPLSLACAGLPLAGRLLVAAAVLGPLGVALGMPFPTGLAALAARRPGLVPWAIAANGFTSVLGATAALPAAMLFGYRALLVVGLGAYVVVALAFPGYRDSE